MCRQSRGCGHVQLLLHGALALQALAMLLAGRIINLRDHAKNSSAAERGEQLVIRSSDAAFASPCFVCSLTGGPPTCLCCNGIARPSSASFIRICLSDPSAASLTVQLWGVHIDVHGSSTHMSATLSWMSSRPSMPQACLLHRSGRPSANVIHAVIQVARIPSGQLLQCH